MIKNDRGCLGPWGYCAGFIERSADQHGHLILWNGCSHSDFVFEANTHCFFRKTGVTGDIYWFSN